MKEIQEISGVSKEQADALNLDEDWDPEKYDREMANMFNEEYYEEGKCIEERVDE